MLIDREGMWYRVLKARYGEEGGRLREGGRHSLAWWRSLCRVREGIGEGVGSWFDSNIPRVVGDGKNILFLHDIWTGEIPLKVKFPRLFELSVIQECSVEEMLRVMGEDDGWERKISVMIDVGFLILLMGIRCGELTAFSLLKASWWIGRDLRQHFMQFTKMVGLPRSTHLYFRIIWFASVWVLWKERNDRVFQNTVSDLSL
ncbi:hypothetical protein MTR_8g058405 [Medicago truncatula]|uniref:Uncharacterized protein n=1 Tax=Medicago truncatula TaxID=3880 RepID=A0A072U0W0_MEDTR|nr:hypothetical protein MTR_8g058405 [Medicago truncatula]